MTLDESAPAEFLFGHLNLETSPNYSTINPKISPFVASFLYLVIALLYAVLVVAFQYFMLYENHEVSRILGVGMTIICLIGLAGIKSMVALKRYGPDLVERSRGVTKFIITQIILAYLISFLVLFSIAAMIWRNNAQDSPITIMLAVLIALFIYTRGISDIGLITAGLGIGIFPSWGGVKHSLSNLYLISNVNGSKENQLAILRMCLWIFTYSVLILEEMYWVLLLGSVVFVILFLRWEKSNGSSILMQLRGIINEISPSDLPQDPSLVDFDMTEMKLEEPKVTRRGIYDLMKRRKQPSMQSFFRDQKQDLLPVAARSINKIVDKIRDETTPTVNKMYCKSCNKEMRSDSRFCVHCSDPMEFTANSSI